MRKVKPMKMSEAHWRSRAEYEKEERNRLESAYQILLAALQYLGKQGNDYAEQEAERAEKMRKT